jgi:hypothetical protein
MNAAIQLREFVNADGPRRWKRISLAQEIFVRWLTTGAKTAFEIVDGIPDGAKVVNILAAYPDIILLLVEHESFDEVPISNEIPELMITVRAI